MKTRHSQNNSDSKHLSSLITTHCSTIQRKAKHLNSEELSAILDDCVHELNIKSLPSKIKVNSLNEIVHSLNLNSPPSLISLNSHYFFILLRNTIRDLLQQLSTKYKLTQQETYLLRNCILLLQDFIKKLNDVSKILHWITDITFLEVLASCLYKVIKISKVDENNLFVKQISRLINIFIIIQERLPGHLHQSLFIRLLKPVIKCLTSTTYLQIFKDLKTSSDSLTALEKLFLIKCPCFLISYNGPHIEKPIEQILKIIVPHYIIILNKHIKTIKEWQHPIIHAIHYLLTILNFAKGSFTIYTNNSLLRLLINRLLRLLKEPILINNLNKDATNPESLLINTVLQIFSTLVYEPNVLDYIQQCKPSMIFRQLISVPCEKILWNSYMMLAYTVDENDIERSNDDLTQLLYTTVNLLHSTIESRNNENTNRNIIQLTRVLKGLVKHEQVKNEVLKHNAVSFLIECSQKLNGLSKQFLLECLWTLSFNKPAAQQMRENAQFMNSLQSIAEFSVSNHVQNTPPRLINDGLVWNLIKESQHQGLKDESGDRKHKYDITISYCHQDKDMVDKIQQCLTDQGFDISSNSNKSYEQTMETVAKTIDNSALILVCISDSYKQDNHCQAVGEYAFKSKRFILPLIVHKEYKFDGWLASIINKNMSVDFSISDFKIASSLLIKTINQHHKKKLETIISMNIEQPIRPSTYIIIGRQQQQISERVISRSITPVNTDSNKSSVVPTISIVNGTDRIYLPEKYTKRDTSNSSYHSLPINIWKRKDLLDFLYDLKLNQMMPLCESMTGETLIEFFRMCQTKPTHLYKQLNKNLRTRFKGFILPISVYTQFLIYINHLLDSVYDTPPLSDNNIEHFAYTPGISQSQVSALYFIKTPSRPIKTIPNSPKRIYIRTVFRPPPTDIRA